MMFARPGSYWFGRTTTLPAVGTLPAYVPGLVNPVSVRQPLKDVTLFPLGVWSHAVAVESPKNVLPLHVWPLRFPMFHSMPPSVKLNSVFPVTVAVAQAPTRDHPPEK